MAKKVQVTISFDADDRVTKTFVPKQKIAQPSQKVVADRPEQNGIRHPGLNSLCGKAWTMFYELGNLTNKEFQAAAIARGLNPGNASTEASRWRKFHGLPSPHAARAKK